MKVLHLTTHLNTGGITTYIYRLICPLRHHGIELSVLSSGGSETEQFLAQGAVCHEFPIRTKSELSPRIYGNLPAIIRLVREKGFNLLHAHTRVTQILAYWIQRFVPVPVVTTCHGFYKVRLGRRLIPAWGDRAIAISEPVADHLKNDFRVAPERVTTVNNAVDLASLDASYRRHSAVGCKKKYGFDSKDFVVGIVARLVEDKGHEYLIRAAHQLLAEMPMLKILIVGDGRYRSALESLAEELKLKDRVVFTGSVSDVTQPLAAMDHFVLPATWSEGFGLSIIEAMTCFKPVIVTNIWSLNSLIQDGVTGILVEPKNVGVLAAEILRLFQNPDLRRTMGMTGRHLVEQMFTIDRMAQDITAIYKRLAFQKS